MVPSYSFNKEAIIYSGGGTKFYPLTKVIKADLHLRFKDAIQISMNVLFQNVLLSLHE